MPHITTDDGARIAYRFDGPDSAPVLLLSNSLGTAMAMWEPQMAALAERFHVLRYDSRGHGSSDAPPGPYTVERLGRDALALLDSQEVARAHVAGVSKGGMVGQWLGANAPGRVGRLVLANTSAHIGQPEVWDQRIAAVREKGMEAVVPGVIDRWFTKPFQEGHPDAVARIRDMLLATTREGYTACAAAVRDMDQREDLRRIAAPVLAIAGRHDLATPPDHARLIADTVQDGRLLELDAAHLSNIEADAAFTAAVLDFLR